MSDGGGEEEFRGEIGKVAVAAGSFLFLFALRAATTNSPQSPGFRGTCGLLDSFSSPPLFPSCTPLGLRDVIGLSPHGRGDRSRLARGEICAYISGKHNIFFLGNEKTTMAAQRNQCCFHRSRVSPSRLFRPFRPSREASFDEFLCHRRKKARSIGVFVAQSEAKKGEASLSLPPWFFFFFLREILPASPRRPHRTPMSRSSKPLTYL